MGDIFGDPVLFGLLWAIAVLAGVLIGWNLRAYWPEREMAKLLERTTQERNALARLYTQIKHRYELREADLRKTSIEVGTLREQVETYESERAFLLTTAQANTTRMERAEANVALWSERMPELEAEAQRLHAENEMLEAELSKIKGQINAWKTLNMGFSSMHQQMRELEAKNSALEMERRLLREQLEIIRGEYEQQQQELARLAARVQQQLPDMTSASSSDGDTGPTQTPGRPDNLLNIKGITEEHARRLHEVGVFTFVQISEWEVDDLVTIAKVLGIDPIKIVQDDWVGQAQVLVAGPQP
jgi:predicted flap endonuclease-1-like 5' DNA nuclease